VEKTWKPKVAGALCIIAGSLILVIPIAVIGNSGVQTPAPPDDIGAALFMVIFVCIPLIMLGTVAVVGGIYASRRQIWALALAGSICALPAGLILGILAIVFIVRGKGEFKAEAPAGVYRLNRGELLLYLPFSLGSSVHIGSILVGPELQS